MGGKHWKLGSNASSLLCSFQMECFFRLVWVCFFVCLFVLQGFFGVCGATYHSTEDKKNSPFSAFFIAIYQLLEKKDCVSWSFQKLWTLLLTLSWQFQTPELATFLYGWNPRSCFLANSSLHSPVKAEWHRCFLPHTHYLETFRC